jgi:hypothetical protein
MRGVVETSSPELKRLIAEAVHRAVCDVTEGDGCGQCMLYAAAGWVLAARVFGRRYMPQAGKLYIVADPPHGKIAFEQTSLESGEFHCWFAYSRTGQTGPAAELVDLSARHCSATTIPQL